MELWKKAKCTLLCIHSIHVCLRNPDFSMALPSICSLLWCYYILLYFLLPSSRQQWCCYLRFLIKIWGRIIFSLNKNVLKILWKYFYLFNGWFHFDVSFENKSFILLFFICVICVFFPCFLKKIRYVQNCYLLE